MSRIFIYDGREFPDPDPSLSPEEIKQMMAGFFPELSNADVTESARGDDQLFKFQRKVGTKGY